MLHAIGRIPSVNPLDRFLCVLHASCSILIKGHLFLRNHGHCLSICFCDLFKKIIFVNTSNSQEKKRTVAVVLQKRAVCTMRNEMKQVAETVYKNGTFIATERSCT